MANNKFKLLFFILQTELKTLGDEGLKRSNSNEAKTMLHPPNLTAALELCQHHGYLLHAGHSDELHAKKRPRRGTVILEIFM